MPQEKAWFCPYAAIPHKHALDYTHQQGCEALEKPHAFSHRKLFVNLQHLTIDHLGAADSVPLRCRAYILSPPAAFWEVLKASTIMNVPSASGICCVIKALSNAWE